MIRRFVRAATFAAGFAALGAGAVWMHPNSAASGTLVPPSSSAKPAIARHSRRLALILANATYPDADKAAGRSISDAAELAESLRGRGYDVALVSDVTKSKMADAVDTLAAASGPGIDVLVAFTGYGIQVDRQNYLIPVDAHIWNEGDVALEGTSLSKLLARLQATGADHIVAVLDASRHNPFERRFRSVSRGLAIVAPPPATFVLATTAPARSAAYDNGSVTLLHAFNATLESGDRDVETLLGRARHTFSTSTDAQDIPTVTSTTTESARL